MPKYYVQCGQKDMGIFQAGDSVEACFALIIKMLNRDGDSIQIAPIMTTSEAGFAQDLEKYGSQKMQDEQIMYSTSSILRLIGMEDVADNLDEWCLDQRNPILMQFLKEMKKAEDFDG